MPAVTLRYFTNSARVQPLRHALADAGVAFEDVRVGLADWPSHREDPTFAGPFAALPTLTWDGTLIAETLPIASFLGRRLGHYAAADDAAIARIEAVISCCYVDVMIRLAQLVYTEAMFAGSSLEQAFGFFIPPTLAKLDRVEKQLPADGWLGGAKPNLADFFAAEAYETCAMMLGPDRDADLSTRLPRLSALADSVRTRPTIEKVWESRPPTLTAHPEEAKLFARLHAAPVAIGTMHASSDPKR